MNIATKKERRDIDTGYIVSYCSTYLVNKAIVNPITTLIWKLPNPHPVVPKTRNRFGPNEWSAGSIILSCNSYNSPIIIIINRIQWLILVIVEC